MKKLPFLATTLLLALFCGTQVHAEMVIRISVKFILGPADEHPDNAGGIIGPTGVNLNSTQAIRDNVAVMNAILHKQAQGMSVALRNDTVYEVSGLGGSWFTENFRSSTARTAVYDIATASAASKTTWKWHDDSVNIYINDSSSGYCSPVSDNKPVIVAGAGAYQELLLHEMGHFFNLAHTHSGDGDGVLPTGAWQDGDGLSETLADDADVGDGATALANITAKYPLATQKQREDLAYNLMSYHQPQDRFVPQQRQIFLEAANADRAPMVAGRAYFIASTGLNGNDGLTWAERKKNIGNAYTISTTANDILLIETGSYNAATESLPLTLTKPMVLSAWRGAVNITR